MKQALVAQNRVGKTHGRVTASILLQDVRVGDQIDIDYRCAAKIPCTTPTMLNLSGSLKGPTAQFQFRLLAAAGRKIQYKTGTTNFSVDSHVSAAGVRETIFRRNSVAQIRADPGAPSYAFIPDQLQLSEFDDWRHVRRWGQRLFVEAASQAAGLKNEAAEIRLRAQDPAGRLLETLKFVPNSSRTGHRTMSCSTSRKKRQKALSK